MKEIRQQILDLLHREPFTHFAIITSAGVRYDVTNPDAMAVTPQMVHYYPPRLDRALHLPYLQIATIEELASSKSKK